jgi:hypothetical protein
MEFSLPKTKAGWIALSTLAILVLVFLYFFTPVFHAHAVEISFENTSAAPVFASIDNTGRHGEGTATDTLQTTVGGKTSPGLRVNPSQSRSFGFAVGLFDSPTLHVWQIREDGLAISDSVHDCPFDTVNYSKFEIPSIHKKLKWDGKNCDLAN